MIYWILWAIGVVAGIIIALYALKMRRDPRLVIKVRNALKFDKKTLDAIIVGFVSTGVFGLLILFGFFLKIKFLFTEWMDASTIAPLYILWMIFLVISLWKIFTARGLTQRGIGMRA